VASKGSLLDVRNGGVFPYETSIVGRITAIDLFLGESPPESAAPLINKLSAGFSRNVTAMLMLDQVETVAESADPARVASYRCLPHESPTGVDPMPLTTEAVRILKPLSKAELLWASPREVLNMSHGRRRQSNVTDVPSREVSTV
jgi:hypothetical protein